MKRARILLADDHRIVAEGLRGLLEPEFELVGIVEDGRALLAAAEKLRPDVIVADISMPLLNGIDSVRQIKKTHEDIKVVFLTMHPDVTYAASAFEAGASGYVLKHSAPAELITAIHSALNGKTYVTPLLAGELMQFYKEKPDNRDEDTRLTPRRREVLQLLSEGRSAKEIATILNISPRTVEFHKYQIMDGLGLKTFADLLQYAIRHGIVAHSVSPSVNPERNTSEK
ncbi:MAG: response regulator transcription factor [Nitrospiraceae bacterium]|nr:response regulator transcription factor [Nitrospiraceae bacterium]